MTISSKDYQNTRKTHIFFGVEDERGTHPQPPVPNSTGIEQRVIVCSQPYPTQRPNLCTTHGEFPACDDYASVSSTHWTIVKSKRAES
jgi:hypothetical protein